jgi:hypothetical protein
MTIENNLKEFHLSLILKQKSISSKLNSNLMMQKIAIRLTFNCYAYYLVNFNF